MNRHRDRFRSQNIVKIEDGWDLHNRILDVVELHLDQFESAAELQGEELDWSTFITSTRFDGLVDGLLVTTRMDVKRK